jgi:hypothetical protein
MIDTDAASLKTALEIGMVFTEIVQKPGNPSRSISSPGGTELFSKRRNLRQMLCERLPVALAVIF